MRWIQRAAYLTSQLGKVEEQVSAVDLFTREPVPAFNSSTKLTVFIDDLRLPVCHELR